MFLTFDHFGMSRNSSKRSVSSLLVSDGLFKTMGLRLQPPDQSEIDRYKTSMREQLSEEAFKSAWETEQAMSLDEAVAYVLEEDTN